MELGIEIVIPKIFLCMMGLTWIIRTTSIVMCGENFKEGSVPVCWFVLVLNSKFRGQDFFKEGRM